MNIHTQTNKHMWVCMKQRAKTQTQTSSTITTIICQLSFVRLKQQYQTAATTVSRISAINKRIKFDYILIILCHKKYSIPNEIGSEFECHWLNISIHTFKKRRSFWVCPSPIDVRASIIKEKCTWVTYVWRECVHVARMRFDLYVMCVCMCT